ncbi:MAG: GntR family transcriptional regulator [Firmicutes bacterium]|nr:GntR family transcriptional regulator [Bacillota bacterium]
MKGIKKLSLVDQVYEQLKSEIVTLKRPLGAKLNVNELQEVLGVSCTPIREAVNRLQQDGLVTYENNVGAHILDLTAKDVEEIQYVGCLLHCEAAKLSMQQSDPDKVAAELSARLADYKAAKTAQAEALSVVNFIRVFYKYCGNSRLEKSLFAIQGQQILLRNMYASLCPSRASDADLLQAIVDSFAAKDLPSVRLLITQHVERMNKAIIEAL